MNEKTYLIPEGLLKGLIDYLMTRPYGEVSKAMPALMNLREAPEQPAEQNG